MTALFWKTTAGVLVAVILILALGKQEKDLAMMLGMAVCVMAAAAALAILEPVLDFLYRLSELAGIHSDLTETLIKITGIGMVSELARMICADSGNTALAQGMHLMGTAMILLLSLPVLESLLDLMQQILGEL